MSEQLAKQKAFDYSANLVIQREDRGPRNDLPSGEPDSLAGKIKYKMGDLAQREKPKRPAKKPVQATKVPADSSILETKKTKLPGDKVQNILNVEISEGLIYQPKTRENRILYEKLISIIHQCLGDEPQDVLRSVTDEVLAVLKMDSMKDNDKKVEIEAMIGKLSPEIFSVILNIAKQMNDYAVVNEENIDKYEEDVQVPVIFDEEKKDEDEDDENEIAIDDDELDEEGAGEEGREGLGLKERIEVEEVEDSNDLNVNQIDAYWIQTELNKHFNDPLVIQQMESEIMKILNVSSDIECENKLVALLNYDKWNLIKLFLKNRWKIFYCTKLKQAQSTKEKDKITEEMRQNLAGEQVLDQLELATKSDINIEKTGSSKALRKEVANLTKKTKDLITQSGDFVLEKLTITDEKFSKMPKRILDLEALSFNQTGHLMSNDKVSLPPGSWRLSKKGYEEVCVPAVKSKGDDIPLIKVSQLPDWAQTAFAGIRELNRIQSKVYHTAFESQENMLVCAPTGSGKTNIALLCILQQMSLYRRSNGEIDLNKFKVVYISPMKALVAEQVGSFTKRLAPYGVVIKELTGDMQLTKAQIQETQIIVATPEKWDIITRKSGDRAYLDLVKLIIIDEIHLLHDSRGPVLETIVARTLRTIESTQAYQPIYKLLLQELVRIVGLSATLPNYADVAAFIRVRADRGLFYFDNSYRPVPLEQQYIGITEKKAVRKMMLMNEILYEKVSERAGKFQMLIFVHSRRETIKTAKALREMAFAKDELGKFLKPDSNSYTILQGEAENARNPDLKELLKFGFAIHHAGLHRLDRTLVEDLFADKHIQVLISTATLAWGVNLPAHTVIIKGTQIYSPEQGKWIEITPQDMLQMLGRAGRPLYDTTGEGIIITSYQELKYYLSLLNQQLPIESQFISQLSDQMNAEIVLGTILNLKDAVNWLGYSYLYIRMLRNPQTYGISLDEIEDDPLLIKRRTDLVHSAATLLDKHNLIKYDKKTGTFQVTALGKIASHYYIKYPSIATFNEHIKPAMGIIELFRVFSLSHEFKYIPIREEEKIEVQKLLESVPIPVKGAQDEPSTKVNVLLQAYVSKLKLEGFALNADMVYISQSAGRIMRGLFEIFLRRGWANIAEIALNLCKMIDRRMWSCMTPLRQFKGLPEEILRRIEKKEQFTWDHYYNMSSQHLGDLVKFPKLGKTLHRLIHQFPRIELTAYVQPITRSCLRVELSVTPDFQWDNDIHGRAEPFWIFVEDIDNEILLYNEQFVLKSKYQTGEAKEYLFEFTVPLFEPLHPQYFIKVISDRWIQCEAQLPISFTNLILPEKFPAPTELLDLQPLPLGTLKWPQVENLLRKLIKSDYLNPIQTQVFSAFYSNDESVFLGAPTSSGKTLCALLAMLRCIKEHPTSKIVYVGPFESVCKQKLKEFSQVFIPLKKSICMLTGQTAMDSKLIEKNDIIISSPDYWDILSRRWKQRKQIHNVRLFIADELHLLGEQGSTTEIITSRMRYIAGQIEKSIRIVGLATSIADYRDMAEWIGAPSHNTFNFHPNVRPVPLEIYIQGFDNNQRHIRLLAMGKHIFQGIKQHAKDKPVIIFVSDRKQARLAALDLVIMAGAEANQKRFLHLRNEELEPFIAKIKEKPLKHCLEYGIGFIYEGMDEKERDIVEKLYESGAIQLLVSTYKLCWEINLTAFIVVVMDTQRYDGQEKRYIDYTIPDMLQIMGRASRPQDDDHAKCLVYCHTPKKDFYKKFLYEPFPVESHLNHFLGDHINAEVVSKTIENKQDCIDYITWTFFYRRLTLNPNYYNLHGVTGTQINDYLSDLVETTIEELLQAKCIDTVEDIDLSPLNLGIIASYYYIRSSTINLFSQNINANFKLKQTIDVLSRASEFDIVPIRHGEDKILKQLSTEINYKIEKPKFNEPFTKTNILLQAHFSRIPITTDFIFDQKIILENSIRLIQAMVDVISSSGWLKPAIIAMQLSQMIIQAMWITDSQLLQLPHINKAIVELFNGEDVKDIADLMNMDDDKRNDVFNKAELNEKQISEIAEACNKYPTINMNYELDESEEILSGETFSLQIGLTRDADELFDFVSAPYYPKDKEEFWWIVVGDTKNNKIYAIKRINFAKNFKVDLKVTAPDEGEHELSLFLISDSYVGCDLTEKFSVKVLPNSERKDDESQQVKTKKKLA